MSTSLLHSKTRRTICSCPEAAAQCSGVFPDWFLKWLAPRWMRSMAVDTWPFAHALCNAVLLLPSTQLMIYGKSSGVLELHPSLPTGPVLSPVPGCTYHYSCFILSSSISLFSFIFILGTSNITYALMPYMYAGWQHRRRERITFFVSRFTGTRDEKSWKLKIPSASHDRFFLNSKCRRKAYLNFCWGRQTTTFEHVFPKYLNLFEHWLRLGPDWHFKPRGPGHSFCRSCVVQCL
jgi:hypothetical protein